MPTTRPNSRNLKSAAKPKFYTTKRSRFIMIGAAVAVLVGGIGAALLSQSDAATGCRTNTYRQGSKTSRAGCVGTLQIAVNVKPDGDFGPNTKKQVIRFQQRTGVSPANGVAGPSTWNAICRSMNTFNSALVQSASKIGCTRKSGRWAANTDATVSTFAASQLQLQSSLAKFRFDY